jgi:hypothetical protein
MPQPWPPPPDLASIEELVRNADPEGHIAEGAAADEYEPEEEAIFAALSPVPTNQLVASTILPVVEQIWRNSFAHDDEAMQRVRPALLSLAKEIERFFGPDSTPRTRGEILSGE